jgi:DNA-binding CsgD family transcriptional regulator
MRDPDRCAWHRAQASAGTDENVAAELERSADRAQARGGLAAAAAFLERAMELTPETVPRARRALAAAQTKLQAGSAEAAERLLAVAEAGPLRKEDRAHAGLLRGQVAFVSSHGRDAPPLLITAARQLEAVQPSLARDTYLDALAAALYVGRLYGGVTIHDVAAAARAAALPTDSPQDLLLNALAMTITDGYAEGATRLKRAVRAFALADLPVSESLRWLWLATHAAHDVWDEETWQMLCDRHIRLARQVGALAILPLALSARVGLHLFAGELKVASSLVDEIAAVTAATGNDLPPYGALALAAYRGHETEAEALFDAAIANARSRGEGMGLTLIQHAQAVLYSGLSQYEKTLVAAQRAAEHPAELAFSAWSLLPLVEAAVRTGRREQAEEAANRLIAITHACGTEWALGVEACGRALVSDGADADRLYRDALRHLSRTRVPLEIARVRLLYGEWLRRHQRRLDAQEQLQAAYEAFTQMGAEGFAARSRRELNESGGRLQDRTIQSVNDLTAQEAQIARLAVVGRTNSEIAAELFLSPRTVEWHLGKVFTKLGITSRRQLRTALPATDLVGLGLAS